MTVHMNCLFLKMSNSNSAFLIKKHFWVYAYFISKTYVNGQLYPKVLSTKTWTFSWLNKSYKQVHSAMTSKVNFYWSVLPILSFVFKVGNTVDVKTTTFLTE